MVITVTKFEKAFLIHIYLQRVDEVAASSILRSLLGSLKADFHSVQNVARSIFSERFLLKCVKSTTANEICSA